MEKEKMVNIKNGTRPDHSRSMPVFCGCGNFTTLIHYWQVWGLPFTQTMSFTNLLPLVSSHPHCHHSSCNPKWSCPSAMLNVNLKGDRWASNSRKSVGHWQILLWKEHSFIVATVYIKVWNKLWLCDQKRILCDKQGYCVVWKVTVWPSTVLHFLWSALTCVWLVSLFWGLRLTC